MKGISENDVEYFLKIFLIRGDELLMKDMQKFFERNWIQ